jgi:parallel beta-helix repeat protein
VVVPSPRLVLFTVIVAIWLAGCGEGRSGTDLEHAADGEHVCVEIVDDFIADLQAYVDEVGSMSAAEFAEAPPGEHLDTAARAYQERLTEQECDEGLIGVVLGNRLEQIEGRGVVSTMVAESLKSALLGARGPAAEEYRVGPSDDLAVVVAAAPIGSTILLEAAEYHVDEPIAVPHAMTIAGAGAEETVILSRAEGVALIYVGADELRLEGLTISHAPDVPGAVVVVHSGSYLIDDTRIKGGTIHEDGSGGAGLVLGSETYGPASLAGVTERAMRLTDVVITDNEGPGISVIGADAPHIADSTITRNGSCGVCYMGLAGGQLRTSDVSDNGLGIVFSRGAEPRVIRNTISNNEQAGVAIEASARGILDNNVIAGNGDIGVIVSGRAQPVLMRNEISDHADVGVAFSGRSSGALRDGLLDGNRIGVWVEDEAAPMIDRNRITGRAAVGIVFGGASAGHAIANEIFGQDIGTDVRGSATPDLKRNVITRSPQAAFVFREQAGGRAEDNSCVQSPNGIVLVDSAQPERSGNRCALHDQRSPIRDRPPTIEQPPTEVSPPAETPQTEPPPAEDPPPEDPPDDDY